MPCTPGVLFPLVFRRRALCPAVNLLAGYAAFPAGGKGKIGKKRWSVNRIAWSSAIPILDGILELLSCHI
jgi:hypothetical protein